jgi:NTP pyrophosphatase (non-canonical NTP hydrolase)
MKNINVLEQYEKFMQTSKFYPQDKLPITYPALGLNGEAGEVAEKVKKCWRDNNGIFDDKIKHAILKELADTLWYIWACADDMGYTLEDVLQTGIKKVKERQETNTIHGSGDNREEKQSDFFEKHLKTHYGD